MLIFFTKFYNFFFLIITFFYNLFPKKARPILLLLVSLVFFYLMSSKLIICLFSTITSIYLSTILMGKLDEKKNELLDGKSSEEKKQIKKIYNRKKKIVLIACILLNFSFLFLFKYLKFFTINSNHLLNLLNINYQFSVLKIIAPIGISFYTLQALSYLFDVYYGKISADKNYLRVALFISFFPQIVEGPMADDQVWNYVNDYIQGEITREMFWERAKFKHPTHQISFHTLRALNCLTYVKSEEEHE